MILSVEVRDLRKCGIDQDLPIETTRIIGLREIPAGGSLKNPIGVPPQRVVNRDIYQWNFGPDIYGSSVYDSFLVMVASCVYISIFLTKLTVYLR